jgi:hypothetical protein
MHFAALVCGLALLAFAQPQSTMAQSIGGDAARPVAQPVTIEGRVVDDSSGNPLRRAYVTLRPSDSGANATLVDVDENGRFVIRDVRPGNYRLEAEREGYMPGNIVRRDAFRLPSVVYLDNSQRWNNLEIRMKKWGVITGRVQYDDAEPAAGARVQVFRTLRSRGRVSYQQAGAATTNDLGDYRVFGLAPGSYFVAATPLRSAVPGVLEQPRRDRNGLEIAPIAYPTTFFPNTIRLTQAAPVRVNAAQEAASIDIFLLPVRKVRVRGRVWNPVSNRSMPEAAIQVSRLDADGAVGPQVPVQPIPLRGGEDTYEIRGLSAGQYLVTADAQDGGKRLTSRRILNVSENDVENFDFQLGTSERWEGRVVMEDRSRLEAGGLRMIFEPRSDRSSVVAADLDSDGSFKANLLADEVYDAFVQNLAGGLFIKSIRAGSQEFLPAGLTGTPPPDRRIEVVLSAKGASVNGRVFTEDGSVATGASLMLIPDPPTGRLQSYRETLADEFAYFRMLGVPPGKYVLIAWVDEPPCDVFDAADLDTCRGIGVPVTLSESGGANLPFVLRTPKR